MCWTPVSVAGAVLIGEEAGIFSIGLFALMSEREYSVPHPRGPSRMAAISSPDAHPILQR
eukprot:3930376-Pyramimonas_sp.AAC.3